MDFIDKIIASITEHQAVIITIGAAIIEVILRLWKSDKIRSIFSYAGRLLAALSKLVFLLSDLLSKVVPDRRPGDAVPLSDLTKPAEK